MSEDIKTMRDERANFEQFVKSQGGSVVMREGVYIESMTRLWLTCWNARAVLSASASQKPQSVFLQNLHHAYAQTDGTYKFPNSREGDMLKQAKREIEASASDKKDAELCRQWFDAVQDLNPVYLELVDYELAKKLYVQLGIRVPSSIENHIAANANDKGISE